MREVIVRGFKLKLERVIIMLKKVTFSEKFIRECAKRSVPGAVGKPLPRAAQQAMTEDLPSPGEAEKALKGRFDLTTVVTPQALFSENTLKKLEQADKKLAEHHRKVSPY